MPQYRTVGSAHPAHPQTVVEDDYGIRWLLSPDRSVPADVQRAVEAKPPSGVVTQGPTGWSVRAWEEDRWRELDHFPTLLDLSQQPVTRPQEDPASVGWVNLHCHSEMSLLDGLSTAEEIVQAAVAQGSPYAAVTDHGNVACHPDLQKACDKAGIRPVFGIEGYLVDDRHRRLENFGEAAPVRADYPTLAAHAEATKAYKERRSAYVASLRDYWHVVLLATDRTGLRNVWSASTESFRDGLYGKNPRMDWDTLRRHSEGVIATTGCLRGPLWHGALDHGDKQTAIARLGTLMEIFPGRLYVEVHANRLPEQREANQALAALAEQFDLPLVAAADSHYALAEQKQTHQVWIAVQTNRTEGDDSDLFAGGQDYHLSTEAEVRESLAWSGLTDAQIDEAIQNTGVIASQSTARIEGKPTPPVYSKGGREEDKQRLLDMCLDNWAKVQGQRVDEQQYLDRFEREINLIFKKSFAGYFLMTADMTNYARSQGILVGPGRGSGASSLVAYLANITDVDPVDAGLMFERFITDGRTELPDFDIDYPASKKQVMQQYVRDRYGDDHVTVVGSILRLKNKGVIDKVARVLRDSLPGDFGKDHESIRRIIEDAEADTAGLGMSWDDLMSTQEELLAPFVERYPRLFALAGQLVGRANAFGQHAAGMVISTGEALTDSLPLRKAKDDGHMVAQFDKDVLEELGFVKFDLLTLRNLDTVQDTIDLVKARRGITIDPYKWRQEYSDPQVWQEICEAHTLGLFQIETTLGTRYAVRMQPKSLSDLADLVTIVRPGPRNSGLTETYLARRDGKEAVTFPDDRLKDILARTHGAILYQEDIMQTVMTLAGFDSTEADKIRKILGKKKVDKIAAAGEDFIERAVPLGMERQAAERLWSQMAEFARYSFNFSHAYAYGVLCYWTSWLKFHYPLESLASSLSTVSTDDIPLFVTEARRMGYRVLPPDINVSGVGFTADGVTIRYGIGALKGVGEATAQAVVDGQPYSSYDDFVARMVEPKGSPVNKGVLALLVRIGAFDSFGINRRGIEESLAADKSGVAARCIFMTDGPNPGAPNNLPCTFDWDSEEAPVNPRTGKKLKRKAPPKRCTKACRHYTPPAPVDPATVEPYTDADIRDIEQQMLGLTLSSTPFDVLPDEIREEVTHNAELACLPNGPEGSYDLVGVLRRKRPYTDSTGRPMGFLGVDTERGPVDLVCFNSVWEGGASKAAVGRLYVIGASRNSRGFALEAMEAID